MHDAARRSLNGAQKHLCNLHVGDPTSALCWGSHLCMLGLPPLHVRKTGSNLKYFQPPQYLNYIKIIEEKKILVMATMIAGCKLLYLNGQIILDILCIFWIRIQIRPGRIRNSYYCGYLAKFWV